MARMDIEFSGISEMLAGAEEIAEEMLNEAAPIIEESMKKNLKKSIAHSGESELVNSVKAGKAKMAKNGACILNVNPKGQSKTKVYKRGKKGRKHPVNNALKAIWLEYGIPGQQAPKPWLEATTKDAEQKVLDKMQEVYDKRTQA
ncbi:MAG: hypothetical protein J6M27_15260 [Lachnospiraceae bacterium]|nr:hypothetical protein [Lachnospiraceae bacterium]MBP3297933.1 hypothetical protein [Lachnospiraceae bacterium]